MALIDTGCAKTAISNKFYSQINKISPCFITKAPSINIQTCDGTTHAIEGTISLILLIGQSKQIKTTINTLVVPNLADNILLGLDFLSSQLILKLTPTALFMKSGDRIVKENYDKINHQVTTIKANKLLQDL